MKLACLVGPVLAPRSDKHVNENKTEMSSAEPGGESLIAGKRFLVVEDEFLILLDIQNILETADARSVVTASTLVDALAALGDQPPFDAAILDLKLGKDSSIPIADRLAETAVPFVFLTGAPNEATQARQFSTAPVIGKPFSGEALLSALATAMGR